VGFSDFTAIHLEAFRVGVSSLHAANLGSLGRSDALARESWIGCIEQPLTEKRFEGLEVLAPGECSGVLMGGNLSLLFAYAASGRLALPKGCLLFIEEVNEAPYRIDRMLTSLLVGGHLQQVAGICLGDLTDARPSQANALALGVFRERLAELGIPILAGLPVGHGPSNHPLPLGVPAELSSQPARLVVNSSAAART
jgi:muramoyltetrapeptide carboxypeptidase